MKKPRKIINDPVLIYNRILKSKSYKRLFSDHIINEDQKTEILKCIIDFGTPKKTLPEKLLTLVRYAEIEEIYPNYKTIVNSRGIKVGSDKKTLIMLYGRKEGLKRYSDIVSKNRIKNKKVSPWFNEYWINKGYSPEEAKNIVSENSRKATLSRSKESYQKQSFKIKHSLDYWISRDYTLEEAEVLRIPYLQKMRGNLEDFIYRHGPEEGFRRYQSSKISRRESHEKNGGFLQFIQKSLKASKQSLEVFIPLIKWLAEEFEIEDYYLGFEDRKEWYISDKNIKKENNKVYFYDFYIPKLNLIIEFNGIQWHYRDEDSWKKYSVLKNKKIDIMHTDKDKIETALRNNYNIEILWNDDDVDFNLTKCKERVLEIWKSTIRQ